MKQMIAGVENALKMRAKFRSEGFLVQAEFGYNYNLSQRPPTVAVLFVKNVGGFFRGYYFYEDGTYFNGSN